MILQKLAFDWWRIIILNATKLAKQMSVTLREYCCVRLFFCGGGYVSVHEGAAMAWGLNKFFNDGTLADVIFGIQIFNNLLSCFQTRLYPRIVEEVGFLTK